ncbi:hypothetical protein IQ276_025845 [Desmonostoc muscorum LEGE 12446]|uniref:Uncharacterized protein n=1 Tax=Desmonostoc muscorum LEGE 12446 TaxID=1828758 RepID=A0A8J7D858_DESMC|nr:hypothetical protein [Desmonostoc muscorum]MCF2149787.1 hypothetical protein [Desmonostoc muscorum LEGE 12446]
MTVYFEQYKELLLEIFYTEDGYCYAACDHPFGHGTLESELCYEPKQAFERLKMKIDFIYDGLG